MELGEKIRQARQEAGLSQRQLCGEDITRNMLSLIENGSAAPSMKTLTLLAERLGKPVSYFLDKNARDPSDLSDSAEALRQAEEALSAGKDRYAVQLLQSVTSPLLLREKLLLAARIPGSDLEAICRALPSLDMELLLRAEVSLEAGQFDRCGCLLAAVENQEDPRWNLLMGKLSMGRGQWADAAGFLQKAEESTAVPLLEICYRELGDYQKAYEYACKQRG